MGVFKMSKGEFTVESTSIAVKKTEMKIVGIGTIPIKTEYDLTNIPEEHHEICLSMIENGM